MLGFLNLREKENRVDKLVNLAIYFLPLVFIDQFGFIYLLSVTAMINLFYYKQNSCGIVSEIDKTEKIKAILIAVISVSVIYLFAFLALIGKLDNGLSIKGVLLIPTYSIIVYYAIPIAWGLKNKDILHSFFKIDKKVVKVTILILFPIILSNFITVFCYSYTGSSKTHLISNIFQFVFTAALGEELFYRGFLYSILKKVWNVKFAMILSSFIFTASHFNVFASIFNGGGWIYLFNFVSIFALGILNCIIYERSKSLIPTIILHACINGAFRDLLALLVLS